MSPEDIHKILEKFTSAKENEVRDPGLRSDVTITCGPLTFSAHKFILSMHSPYFEAMFKSPMKEESMNSIEIKEQLDPLALEEILNYMYTDTIDINNGTEHILKAAQYLLIPEITNECVTKLIKSTSYKEFLNTWDFLELHGQVEATNKITDKLAEQFSDVLLTEEFLELTEDRLGKIIKCINWDNHRHEIFPAILKWTMFDYTNRNNQLENLLRNVKLSGFPAALLVQLLEDESNSNVWNFPIFAKRINLELLKIFWPRQLCILTLHDYSADKMRIRIFPPPGKFYAVTSYPQIDFTCTSTGFNNFFSHKNLIFFQFPSVIHVFNVETKIKTTLPPLPIPSEPDSRSRGTVCRGYLYVIDSNNFLRLQLDATDSQIWKQLIPPPFPPKNSYIFTPILTIFDDNLFQIGQNPFIIHMYLVDQGQWVSSSFGDAEFEFNCNSPIINFTDQNSVYIMNSATYQLYRLIFNYYPRFKVKIAAIPTDIIPENAADAKCFLVDPKFLYCQVLDVTGCLREYHFGEKKWFTLVHNHFLAGSLQFAVVAEICENVYSRSIRGIL